MFLYGLTMLFKLRTWKYQVLQHTFYSDQTLWEVVVAEKDGKDRLDRTFLLSLYPEFQFCTCETERCNHLVYFFREYLKSPVDRGKPNSLNWERMARIAGTLGKPSLVAPTVPVIRNEDCCVCMDTIAPGTKLVLCGECQHAVHKACWLETFRHTLQRRAMKKKMSSV